ncbi:rhomboid family intramembrane serine protease [Cognataquiflexum aquatile]|uniref:rhomboid family intramembrane serine protease n=1 Tax=Cognataquiflexum aquatile TaxID=2249427 RepID=UPI000DE804BE|nr:rhomboid family intramembrane serine protease [Cognataquiflexum aquatile]
MKDKINLLFVPFVFTLVGLTLGYTFLHWIIFIELELFQLKDIIISFGIPIVLTALAAWFILRPRFKILNLEAKNGNWRDFYSAIMWMAFTAPLLIAQQYVVSATGKLTELNSINEINNSESTKYYTIKNFFIDKFAIGLHSAFDVSGKNNESFNMHIYVALPIFESLKDTTILEPKAWFGIEYRKTISNRLEPNEKEKKYQEFAKESELDFEHKNVSEFVYLDRIRHSDKKEGYIEAIKANPKYIPNEIILEPINEPFEARNGKKLEWIIGSSIIGSIVWLIMVLVPKIDENELKRIKEGKPDHKAQKEFQEFVGFLKPKKGYFITPILINANIGIYLIMVVMGFGFISFKGQDLLQLGANYGPLTKNGEWWRLLTNTFLHGGLMHLLANMFGLTFVGSILEPKLGKLKLLTFYLITGILASIASIWWYEAIISVGASGPILGLYGIFLTFLLTKIFPPEFSTSFFISTSIFIGFTLLMGLAGGIDNAAHIGGLLSGFIVGLIISPIIKNKQKIKRLKKTKKATLLRQD